MRWLSNYSILSYSHCSAGFGNYFNWAFRKFSNFQPLKIVREDIRIPSIIYDHPADFKRTIQLMESNSIQPGKIISGRYHLLQLQTALEAAAGGSESKLIITIYP